MQDQPQKPTEFNERYRLYVDESGDHVFRETYTIAHRYLCLMGSWFKNPEYLKFHAALETLKQSYFPTHPDDPPVVFHREDMLNARKAFRSLQNGETRAAFDRDLIQVLSNADFRMVAVVIDKQRLKELYGDASEHPYHLAMGFLMQRFAGYLNHVNRVGDIMAESRGGKEDRLLKSAYAEIYEEGVWKTDAHVFQSAFTTKELKLKPKTANIAGLQLSDILGHPIKQFILRQKAIIQDDEPPFARELMAAVAHKFNAHLYSGKVEGYGTVLFPKN